VLHGLEFIREILWKGSAENLILIWIHLSTAIGLALGGSTTVHIYKQTIHKLKLNSVTLVRERTIPTERPPPVGEVSANFCG
jgi:hypothetical protein